MPFTISEVLRKSKELIENNPEIGGYISIIGEIGTIKLYGKHAYLSLKEDSSILKGVYFNISDENAEKFKEGSMIEAFGYLSIYEQRGEFQFYIKSAREISKTGVFQQKFEELKQKLLKEGVIPRKESERRVLQEFPEKIGIITSRKGAALQDIIKTFKTRYPEITLNIFHTGVQGKVEKQIIDAITMAENSDVDFLIIARGGGSIEDLWCFNDENVVKKIRYCTKPVVSGIGHETDHTLSEYAADYIASTPTAAAMVSAPDIFAYLAHKKAVISRLDFILEKRINEIKIQLFSLNRILSYKDPLLEIERVRDKIDDLLIKAENILINRVNGLKHRLLSMEYIGKYHMIESRFERIKSRMLVINEKILASDPDKYLKLGYSRIENKGETISSVVQLSAGDVIDIYLKDGILKAKVKNILKN
ncbi:MAG TPA: exodeoxyribonuclease VII large subunit [Thermotogota bacterium]|nr:exodeoxyribonuclease VII large subunit [Thermotogota bacterium]HPR94797.1 exodeoxyribonuclease VII large subunit [Thermotogota bacterium]